MGIMDSACIYIEISSSAGLISLRNDAPAALKGLGILFMKQPVLFFSVAMTTAQCMFFGVWSVLLHELLFDLQDASNGLKRCRTVYYRDGALH